MAKLPIASVLDLGCAAGTWLRAWKDNGATEVLGIDGHHLPATKLHIEQNEFNRHDHIQPIRLGRKFDLVQSLEVAEHLPPERAAGFIDELVAHSRGMVLFSAATPGQGGE